MTLYATLDREADFPLDWTEWRNVWRIWHDEMRSRGILRPSSWRGFPSQRNFLADEVLGVFSIPDSVGTPSHVAELSEVRFPDLGSGIRGKDARFVGITFGLGSGNVTAGPVRNFADLEKALGIDKLTLEIV